MTPVTKQPSLPKLQRIQVLSVQHRVEDQMEDAAEELRQVASRDAIAITSTAS